MKSIHKFLCRLGLHDQRGWFGDVLVCAYCRKRTIVLDTGYWDLDICDTRWVNDTIDDMPCLLPPEGWFCSRQGGHEGPCAARPI